MHGRMLAKGKGEEGCLAYRLVALASFAFCLSAALKSKGKIRAKIELETLYC